MGRKARQKERRKLENGKTHPKRPVWNPSGDVSGIRGLHMGPKGTVRWYAPDPEVEEELAEDLHDKPLSWQDLYKRFDAFGLYLLEETDQIVSIEGCRGSPCGHEITFNVGITREFNPSLTWERNVFGIDPRALKPLTVEEVEHRIKTEPPADPKLVKAMEDPNFRREFYQAAAEKLGIDVNGCDDPACGCHGIKGGATA